MKGDRKVIYFFDGVAGDLWGEVKVLPMAIEELRKRKIADTVIVEIENDIMAGERSVGRGIDDLAFGGLNEAKGSHRCGGVESKLLFEFGGKRMRTVRGLTHLNSPEKKLSSRAQDFVLLPAPVARASLRAVSGESLVELRGERKRQRAPLTFGTKHGQHSSLSNFAGLQYKRSASERLRGGELQGENFVTDRAAGQAGILCASRRLAGRETRIRNCRGQAIAQACAFASPFSASMSAMGIYQQLAPMLLRFSDVDRALRNACLPRHFFRFSLASHSFTVSMSCASVPPLRHTRS
jgi:hypothetical protein